MTRLKCLNCGAVFDKKALVTYPAVGLTHVGAGVGGGPIVWPFALRVYAECPVCKQKGWIKVLSPWSRDKAAPKSRAGLQ